MVSETARKKSGLRDIFKIFENEHIGLLYSARKEYIRNIRKELSEEL